MEKFIKAAHLQAKGKPAPKETVKLWLDRLKTGDSYRRIDVINTFAQEAGSVYSKDYRLKFSDPWQNHAILTNSLKRTGSRDIIAIWMIWNECPYGVNCGEAWANTHAPGMYFKDPIMSFDDAGSGYYNYSNAAYYYMELMDARYAGIQALMPNVYGRECLPDSLEMKALSEALIKIEKEGWDNPVKIALMDDTWMWGRPWHGPEFSKAPNLADTVKAAHTL